jgi:hypothetical protein
MLSFSSLEASEQPGDRLMVDINKSNRTIKAKIVYYGPAVGGKTTNLKLLQENAVRDRRGMMISVNSTQERTILFDLLPLRTIGFRGYDLRLQLIGVAGQSMYAPSRKSALKAADGLVFVANSAVDRWEENLQAYAEMTRGLVHNGIDISEIAFVVQFNKRDLPEATPVDVMERGLNPREVPSFPAVARSGEGVLETFAAVLQGTVENIAARYPGLELPTGLTPEAWTQVSIRGMFGRTSLGGGGASAPVAPTPVKLQPRVIKIAPGRGPEGRLDSRSPEAVAESYAEASAELGIAVAEMREERDQAELRLEEVQRTLEVAHDLVEATSFDQGVMRALSCLAEAAEATHATLLVRTAAEGWEARPLPPLQSDPLLAAASAAGWLDEQAASKEPRRVEAGDPVVGPALAAAEPAFSAVVAAPVRDPDSLLGLALLYYAGDVPLPDSKRVEHVGLLARIFSAPLELAHRRQQAAAVQRLHYLSRSGNAAAAWSIAALSRGALDPEAVDLRELLEPLSDLGFELRLAPDLPPISAHPDLIHLAVLTLVSAGETTEPGSVAITGSRESEQVCLQVLVPVGAEPGDEDEAVSALVHWIVATCCHGRLESAVEGGRQRHALWLNPA